MHGFLGPAPKRLMESDSWRGGTYGNHEEASQSSISTHIITVREPLRPPAKPSSSPASDKLSPLLSLFKARARVGKKWSHLSFQNPVKPKVLSVSVYYSSTCPQPLSTKAHEQFKPCFQQPHLSSTQPRLQALHSPVLQGSTRLGFTPQLTP